MKEIITLLVEAYKIDLFKYKAATLRRRIEKRMGELMVKRFKDYKIYIDKHPEEKGVLFHSVLIDVTEFFRDHLAFRMLKKDLRALMAGKKNGESLRIWCAGCATGQEAYSIAIIALEIAESLQIFPQFKIFATDVSLDGISIARRGFYTMEDIKGISDHRLAKYFTKQEDGYLANDKLREMIIFSRHDLTQDPPFIQMDLISCRNVFIYFNTQLQGDLLRLFHFALADEGILFLGKTENVKGDTEGLFETCNKYKLYRRVLRDNHFRLPYRNRPGITNYMEPHGGRARSHSGRLKPNKALYDQVLDAIVKNCDYPWTLVDEGNNILETGGNLASYFHISDGLFSANIFELINNELKSDLYYVISKFKKNRKSVKRQYIRYKRQGKECIISLKILPLIAEKRGHKKNFIIVFEDVTKLVSTMPSFIEAGDKSRNPLKADHGDELKAAKEQIKQYQEQLEHTQSSFISLEEELMATNNELKSSLENFETSNEELQSLNEELSVSNLDFIHTNGKLKEKESELLKSQIINEANKQKYWDLYNNAPDMFASVNLKNKTVLECNKAFYSKLGYSKSEIIGHSMMDFYHPECHRQLKKTMSEFSLSGRVEGVELLMLKKNKEVMWISLNATAIVNEKGQMTASRSILRDITERKKAEEALRESQVRLFNSIENMPTGYILWEPKTNKIIEWNKAAEKIFGFKKVEIIGKNGLLLIVPKGVRRIVSDVLKDLAKGKKAAYSELGNNIKKDGTLISCKWYNTALKRYDGTIFAILSIVDDVTEKYIQERNLRESEEKFRGIFESSNDAIFIIDPINDKIVNANMKAVDMLRYDCIDDLLSIPISVIHRDEMDKMRVFVDSVYQVRHGNTDELTCLRKDGIRIPAEISASVIEMKGNKYILASVRDITERVEAEKELTEQREEQQVILDSVPAMIFYKDREDRFIRVNKALADAFQLPVDEIIGKTAAEISPSGKNYRVDDLEVIESGKSKLNILEPVQTSAGTYWYQTDKIPYKDNSGKIIGIIGCAVDITERLTMESEMNKLSTAVEQSAASIVITDLNGNIEYINPQVVKSTGYSQKELIGNNPRIFKSGVTGKSEYKQLWKTISAGNTWKGEFCNKHKNGKTYWEAATISPIFNKIGKIVSYVAIKEDITDKKSIEAKLKVTMESLEKEVSKRTKKLNQTITTLNGEVQRRLRVENGLQQMLEEKEILLNEISHRVKNNLQVITSLINLQLDGIDDETAKEMFKETTYRIKSMALIHETLYKSKDFSKIDFGDYIRSLTNFVSHYFISSQVAITINISKVSLSIDSATTCGLVLIELITNSFKYAFPNNRGKIFIKAVALKNDKYEIDYSDDGIGLDPAFNVENSKTLGMQLVYGLVKQLKGSIKLFKGKGAHFKIQIKDQIKNG